MNNPEYILTDVFSEIATSVKSALGIQELNYQYGYVTELNETLQQYGKTQEYEAKKFPLLWLAEPFAIQRGEPGVYGITESLDLFIITGTQKTLKASERMSGNFATVLYPIYRELLAQITKHPAFQESDVEKINHIVTNRYYWGEAQQAVLNDVVDCLKIGSLKLRVQNKDNCIPISNI